MSDRRFADRFLSAPFLTASIVVAMSLAGCAGSDSNSVATSTSAEPLTSPSVSVAATASTTSGTAEPNAPTATTTSTTIADEPAPAGLEHLIPGHNRLAADRINLVLAPWGWDDLDDFRSIATMFVGWDGRAQRFGDDGRPVADAEDAFFAELGAFGFEPLRGNRDRFNVWITTESPSGPALYLNGNEEPSYSLPDMSVVTLALDPYRVVPGITSVAGMDAAFGTFPDVERTGTDSVANLMVSVSATYPAGSMLDLPHELGHALFGFADEYVGRVGGDGAPFPRPDAWPSCAASQGTAEAWWGDMVGQYDPMVDVWLEEMAAAGFPQDERAEDMRTGVTTAYIDGGCWGDEGSVRSAENTMMGFTGPAFGLTNRREAERILALWTGE